MISSHVIARRYAKGLLLSLQDQSLDVVLDQFKAFARLYADTKDLRRLCEDPSFSPLDRKKIIDRITEMLQFDPIFHKFLLLLIQKSRIALIESIYLSFARMVDQKKGRLRVRITSATPVIDEEINEIKEILEHLSRKEIVAETSLEKGLMGGIRVETAGTVFDGTLKAKLSALENLLLNDIGY